MVVRVDSFIARLWLKLPVWFGFVESARVGSDCRSFVRIGFFR